MAHKVLVVFYSRSGTTRRAAEAIARLLGGDLEEIYDTRNRQGLLGYLRCGFEAMLGRTPRLEGPRREPSAYDLVVIGTPVWVSSVSSPVRTYLAQEKGRFKQVAFFVTQGGGYNRQVFRQMAELVGKQPVGTFAIRELHVERVLEPFLRFLDQLQAAPELRPPAPVPPPAEVPTTSPGV